MADLPTAIGSFGSLDRFARFLAELASVSGSVALRYFTEGTNVREKEDGSPVTAADLNTQRFIVERLQSECPDLPICAEEDDLQILGQTDGAYLLVDPLDGTKEFLKGSSEWTVNIGLIVHGRPVAGAVSIPAEGAVYWGGTTARFGRYRDGHIDSEVPITVRNPDPKAMICLCSRDHKGESVDTLFRRLGVANPIAAGSSLKMLRIARGEADLYPRLGPTMAWDTAAAHAVLSAAGVTSSPATEGSSLTFRGRPAIHPSSPLARKSCPPRLSQHSKGFDQRSGPFSASPGGARTRQNS